LIRWASLVNSITGIEEKPMGKMEQMLKSEITRLARREMRATCLPLA